MLGLVTAALAVGVVETLIIGTAIRAPGGRLVLRKVVAIVSIVTVRHHILLK